MAIERRRERTGEQRRSRDGERETKTIDEDDRSTEQKIGQRETIDRSIEEKTLESFSTLSDKLRSRCHVVLPSQETVAHRRHVLLCGSISIFTTLTFNCPLMPLSAWARDEVKGEEENKDEGVVGAIKSLFDPDEKTKTGKVLPKGYLKSAREVVKTLRESLKEDPKDVPKFRRTADAAKESIREYLNGWRGQKTVVNEESYVLEKAIRSLASFYSKAGPSAPLPEEVKSEILNDLNTAEEFL